jgi:Lipase (class 3)
LSTDLSPPTDAELVDEAAGTYTRDDPFAADPASALRVFLTKREDGLNIFSIEGTHDDLGWAADFFALRVWDHPGKTMPSIGWVHAGFLDLAWTVLGKLRPAMAAAPYAICGHSLGAAEALLIGATMIDEGSPPIKIGAFAPPRVGDATFVKVATSVPLCAYRFGDDPVPTVPWPIPIFFPYRQVPLTQIGQPMADSFKCHAIANYVAAVHQITASTKTAGAPA